MESQKKLILNYMRMFGGITTFKAFAVMGITRLSARIKDLRDDGYKIMSLSECKNGKRWTRYVLEEEPEDGNCINENKGYDGKNHGRPDREVLG